jgi:hypothetical protein
MPVFQHPITKLGIAHPQTIRIVQFTPWWLLEWFFIRGVMSADPMWSSAPNHYHLGISLHLPHLPNTTSAAPHPRSWLRRLGGSSFPVCQLPWAWVIVVHPLPPTPHACLANLHHQGTCSCRRFLQRKFDRHYLGNERSIWQVSCTFWVLIKFHELRFEFYMQVHT